MNVTELEIPGVLLIEPDVFGDDRGYFFEGFEVKRYAEAGIGQGFVQDNFSFSKKGTLRGLHYQAPPMAQGKLIQVLQGRVIDVGVDIRFGSPTFGRYVTAELSSDNHHQLWLPPGFAHGFLTLSETALFAYKCTNTYSKIYDRGVRYDDPAIGIVWPMTEGLTLSDKDRQQPLLREIAKEFSYDIHQ